MEGRSIFWPFNSYDDRENQAWSILPKVSGSVGRVKDLMPCRSATSLTSACTLKGLNRIGSAPVFRMTSMRRSQSGKSQSITTASNGSRAIASSTDSSLPRNLGCKPRSSTIRPNSAATISSRATINTLSNTPTKRGRKLTGNLRTLTISSATSVPLRYSWEQMSTSPRLVREWGKLFAE